MIEEIISATESLFLPIIIFASAIVIILYLIKKEEKRRVLNNKRYEELTNKFIDTIKNISDENNKMLKELSESIYDITNKFNEQKRDR